MNSTASKSILLAIAAIAMSIAERAAGATNRCTNGHDDTVQNTAAAVEPMATHALDDMAVYLRQQTSFTVDATMRTDYVLDDGQTVRMTTTGELRVHRPNRLRADIESDRKRRQFFYDGETFTMYGPRVGYYAQIAAPATIIELADMLETRYGLQLPLVDLFRWGSEGDPSSQFSSAKYIGAEKLDGVDVDHYAFRQPGLDWQIWIQRGAKPLPRKLLLITTDDPARPEHELVLDWKLGAKHDNDIFLFRPPKESTKIDLAEAQTRHGEAKASRRATKTLRSQR